MTRNRPPRRMRRVSLLAAVPLLAALAIGGCATPSTPGGQPPSGIAARGEVIGQGTVLQVDEDAAPMFCLGGVLESYPPQCDGPEIVGWDWDGVEGAETANGVTWGAYALQGTWDGERFTLTQPAILLALYDPMAIVDPYEDPANAGTNAESRLLEVQAELTTADASLRPLESGPRNGYLFATWIYDDGDLQRYVDDRFGPDVVHVVSALRPVEGG